MRFLICEGLVFRHSPQTYYDFTTADASLPGKWENGKTAYLVFADSRGRKRREARHWRRDFKAR
jgi:hypothetical protein